MIKIIFNEPATQEWSDWITECEAATAALLKQADAGGPLTITDLYKDDRLKRVYISDGPPFHGKCAYCESGILGSQPGDIEHFRPKSRVTEIDNTPVTVLNDKGERRKHPGYYWLAYEWKNLLYACADCNRPSGFKTTKQVGKWDKFPVRGFRANRPGVEASEEPLLLNPVEDEPSEHLHFDCNGVIVAKTDRGNHTIEILGLNWREALVKDRIDAIDDVRNVIHALATACAQRNEREVQKQLQKLQRVKSGARPFAMAGRLALAEARSDFVPLWESLDPGEA